MFVAAAVQGGSLLSAPDHADTVPGPSTSDAGLTVPSGQAPAAVTAPSGPVASDRTAGITPSPTVATALASPPRQAAEWAPGAAPSWNTPLSQLPVRRAPVQGVSKADQSPATASYVNTHTRPDATAAAATPGSTDTSHSGSTPRSANRPDGTGLVGGVLGGVDDLTGALGF
jgi:hypothetical protein